MKKPGYEESSDENILHENQHTIPSKKTYQQLLPPQLTQLNQTKESYPVLEERDPPENPMKQLDLKLTQKADLSKAQLHGVILTQKAKRIRKLKSEDAPDIQKEEHCPCCMLPVVSFT